MTTKNLYRIVRPDGGITVTPNMPTGMEYTLMYRLIADEGKVLIRNGDMDTATCCVDINVEDVANWTEVDEPEPPEPEE